MESLHNAKEQTKKVEMSKRADVTVTLQEIFFYLFFSLLFFAKGIGLYDGQSLFKVFLILALVCFGMKMIMTNYTIKELAILAALAMVVLLSYFNTKEKGILFTFAIVAGLKNIPVKRICKVALAVWCVSYIPMVVLTTLGWVDSPFRVHVRPFIGFAIRWGMGSAHPNVGHIAYLILVVLAVYVLGEKISWKWIVSLFIGNIYVFFYTMSQTGLLMTSFYLAAAVYLTLRKSPSKLEYWLVECVTPACILASLILPVTLTGKAFDILNKLMNTRVMQAKRYLTEEKITLFGSRLRLNNAINTMDNSFVFAFMTYGAVTFIILMAAYILLIKKYVWEKRNLELAVIVTLLLTGLSEPFLFNTSFKNVSLLFMGELIFAASKASEGLWGKKVCFWGIGNREIELPSGGIAVWWIRLKKCACTYKAFAWAGAAIVAVIWAGAYTKLAKVPAKIIVPRSLCDSVEWESIYLAQGEKLEDSLVLGYVDDETPMVVFEDTLSRLESVRGIVCRAVYGTGLGFIVVLGGCYVIKYKDSRQ